MTTDIRCPECLMELEASLTDEGLMLSGKPHDASNPSIGLRLAYADDVLKGLGDTLDLLKELRRQIESVPSHTFGHAEEPYTMGNGTRAILTWPVRDELLGKLDRNIVASENLRLVYEAYADSMKARFE